MRSKPFYSEHVTPERFAELCSQNTEEVEHPKGSRKSRITQCMEDVGEEDEASVNEQSSKSLYESCEDGLLEEAQRDVHGDNLKGEESMFSECSGCVAVSQEASDNTSVEEEDVFQSPSKPEISSKAEEWQEDDEFWESEERPVTVSQPCDSQPPDVKRFHHDGCTITAVQAVDDCAEMCSEQLPQGKMWVRVNDALIIDSFI